MEAVTAAATAVALEVVTVVDMEEAIAAAALEVDMAVTIVVMEDLT